MIREFNAHQYVFSIQPGLEASGWAIFNEHSGRLLECGVAEPFAVGTPAQVLDEMKNKLRQTWEKRVGFSWNPEVLVVETHRLHVSKDTSIYTFLAGMLRELFKARTTYLPSPSDVFVEDTLKLLDSYSQRVLKEALFERPAVHKESIIRAVSLGIWGQKKWHNGHETKIAKSASLS